MAPILFSDGSSFEPTSGEVQRHGAVGRLEPQPAAVLALLAARAGELVSHDEMRRAIWGDATHVNFQEGLHYAIRRIRLTFDDTPRTPWLIETIPRRGYRLRASAIRSADRPALLPPTRRTYRRFAVGGTLLLLVGAMWLEQQPNNHHELAVAMARTVHDWLFDARSPSR